jgi:hypothetical protein
MNTKLSNTLVYCPAGLHFIEPGLHFIRPRFGGVSRRHFLVNVTKEWVSILNDDLECWRKLANENLCDLPFGDIEHRSPCLRCDDSAKAFSLVGDFFWCSKGVGCSVSWNEKSSRFCIFHGLLTISPTLRFDDYTKCQPQLIGTQPNIGGMVHRSAFKEARPTILSQ